MAIDISFILRASTAGFTKGIAAANNSLHDLKKNLKVGDVGNGLKQFLGAGAIIAGFRTAINRAQELRDNMMALGHAVDPAIGSVAKLGDSLDSAGRGLKDLAVGALSKFTQAGEAIGGIINTFRFGGQAGNIEKLSEQTAQDANEAVKRRDAAAAARVQRNSSESLRKLREQLQGAQDERSAAAASDEEKINTLLQQQIRLREQLSGMQANPDAVKNDQAAILAKNIEVIRKGKEIDAAVKAFDEKKFATELEKKNAEKTLKDAQDALANSKIDKFLPSAEELSLTAEFYGRTDPKRAAAGLQARKMFKLEQEAGYAFGRGDKGRAISMMDQAADIRRGLTGYAKSEDVNRDKGAVDAIDKATDELKKVNEKLADIFIVKGK